MQVLPFLLLAPAIALSADNGIISDTPKGFDRQYNKLYEVYRDGGQKAFQATIGEYRIPEAWFVETFGQNKGPQLEEQYTKQYEKFSRLTLQRLQSIVVIAPVVHSNTPGFFPLSEYQGWQDSPGYFPFPDYHLNTHLLAASATAISFDPPVMPLKPIPPILRFMIDYPSGPTNLGAGGTTQFSPFRLSMDAFIYLDGKFRFIGMNGSPFWGQAGVSNIKTSSPCVKSIKHLIYVNPDDKIIDRVEPNYPDEARRRHLIGHVDLLIEVALDGSVKKVDVANMCEPLLADSAKKAVMQWRFRPFTNCGKPVEVQIGETLYFPPG
ncbi:MAG: energy transducer TonB [Candidatus Acidiferrales bacterium]